MKLKKLFKEIPVEEIKGSKDVEITGICANSKLVVPGNLFIARKGRTVDGSRFIPEAISAGAQAVLSDLYDPTLKGVTQVIHSDISGIEGLVSAQFHQFPSDELLMVGITGTNGKTTVSYLIKHLFEALSVPCGLIGTIEYVIGQHRYPATFTTPDVETNHKLLREMVNEGCQAAVMEVTSHALDQGRVDQINFDVAVFTNLSQEHLDYHGTMDAYAQTKNRLFRSLDAARKKGKRRSKMAIVNCDDPYSEQILEGCSASRITYGMRPEADLAAAGVHFTSGGIEFALHYQGRQFPVAIPLIGRHNVYNALAAFACGLSQGLPLEAMITAARSFPQIPGRLECVPGTGGRVAYVDFAHTPDALENVLSSLKELKPRRIITVFGCGGNRDQGKRPVMARVAGKHSYKTIVTTDNPRSEDLHAIIAEIVKGFNAAENFETEPDRRLAIEKAVKLAGPEDVVLIAGKGHEPYQIFAYHTTEFDDRKVVRQAFQDLAMEGRGN